MGLGVSIQDGVGWYVSIRDGVLVYGRGVSIRDSVYEMGC